MPGCRIAACRTSPPPYPGASQHPLILCKCLPEERVTFVRVKEGKKSALLTAARSPQLHGERRGAPVPASALQHWHRLSVCLSVCPSLVLL